MNKLGKALAVGLTMAAMSSGVFAQNDEKITVLPVKGLKDDFIMGVDISSMIALEDAGCSFYTKDGIKEDLLKLLKDGGANCVRIRIWNNPFDKKGRAYGAGNNDINTAVKIAKRAKTAGLDVLIDFHYSDFWADPGKQSAPKAWEKYSLEQKKDALVKFTTQSLEKIKDEAGIIPKMVQVGNEINNGMCGERTDEGVYTLVKAGCDTVRAFDKSILIAIHYTDPTQDGYLLGKSWTLSQFCVDYDVLATSYYPFWHGNLNDLTETLTKVSEQYGKKVMVAETSYAFTNDDGDGYPNVVSKASANQVFNYPFTVEGQAIAVRDVIEAVSNAKDGIGVFYWEPAWIPVNHYDSKAKNAKQALKANQMAWENYGTGWATSFAKEYDPEIKDKKNGGTWDNQALFDFDGKALESINVFKYARVGSKGPLRAVNIEKPYVKFLYGKKNSLPATVKIFYNDGTTGLKNVTWNKKQTEKLLSNPNFGEYKVEGELEDGEKTECTVLVTSDNLITNGNFESGDLNAWEVVNPSEKGWPKVEKNENNASEGKYYFSAWDEKGFDITLKQEVALEKGNYKFFASFQGTGVKNPTGIEIFIIVKEPDGKEKTYKSPVTIPNVWKDFYTAEIDFGVSESTSVIAGIKMNAEFEPATKANGVWLVADDVRLFSAE